MRRAVFRESVAWLRVMLWLYSYCWCCWGFFDWHWLCGWLLNHHRSRSLIGRNFWRSRRCRSRCRSVCRSSLPGVIEHRRQISGCTRGNGNQRRQNARISVIFVEKAEAKGKNTDNRYGRQSYDDYVKQSGRSLAGRHVTCSIYLRFGRSSLVSVAWPSTDPLARSKLRMRSLERFFQRLLLRL